MSSYDFTPLYAGKETVFANPIVLNAEVVHGFKRFESKNHSFELFLTILLFDSLEVQKNWVFQQQIYP